MSRSVPALPALIGMLFGPFALTLIVIGPPGRRAAPVPSAPTAPQPTRVTVAGFTLVSQSIDLPVDAATYPDAPDVNLVNANCTACHSASMAQTQPPLTRQQWEDIVTKMRKVYRAPVAERDVPAIVGYLATMPAGTARGP